MLERDEINGSKWWKFDFHTHTPASQCYGRGAEQQRLKQKTPREWLMDFMRAGIDCVAVTDHNSGTWIDMLKDEYDRMCRELPLPNDFRPLYIFPGVEISTHGGIHILGIFDRSFITEKVTRLMGAVEYNGIPGDCDSVTKKTVPQVVEAIHQQGGIAIPAHVDAERGLFTELTGTTLNQTLTSPNIFAMEVKDKNFVPPSAYREHKLSWTSVVGSDAHHPTADNSSQAETFPGARFTWVKMGEPSLEALKLSLLDGALSVRRFDEIEVGLEPNQHATQIIESLQIHDAKYCGQGKPFSLRFNPWLNTIVGGRGAGKSTIVEFIRATMRREYELNDTEQVKEFFDDFMKVPANRDDRGVIRADTTAELIYLTDNSRYRIQWDQAGNTPAITEILPDKSTRASQGEVARRFPVRIYSQKQIFELAQRPGALITIIDEDPQVNRAEIDEARIEIENSFYTLRAQYRETLAAIREEGTLKGELEDIRRKLAVFETSGHGEILKRFQKARRQKGATDRFTTGLNEIPPKIKDLARSIIPVELDKAFFDENNNHEGYVLELADSVKNEFQSVAEKLSGIKREVEKIVSEWQQKLITSQWYKEFQIAEQEYENLKKRLAKDGIDPGAYGNLVQRRQTLEQKLASIAGLHRQLISIKKQADECLDNLSTLRQALTDQRIEFLKKTLAANSMVKIQVIPYGSAQQAEEEFREIIQRERPTFASDILSEDGRTGVLAELYFQSEKSSQEDYETKLKQLKECLEANKLSSTQDQRFNKYLANLKPEVFDRLHTWFPEDTLEVSYSIKGKGHTFQSIRQGSPGQKTAAILAFLLAYGEEPLVLDQPEDDLDNHLISDLVVRQVRENKQRRQIIIVTHNPNIVVNGDAELVIPMDFRNGQCQFAVDDNQELHPDGLQNRRIREEICRVMEGGKIAFEKRYHRITGGNRNV